MQDNQTLSSLTARVLEGLSDVLRNTTPDVVLVQGDTTTVMAGALAAFYQHVPVGHVEAGLRTGNRFRPFPEEINRRVVDLVSQFYFAPTETAARALRREGIPEDTITVTGNTVIDALQWMVRQPRPQNILNVSRQWEEKKVILVTAHRRENFGEPFQQICQGLLDLSLRNPDLVIVYPVHLNPQVQEPVYELLGDREGIHLIDPLPYQAFVHLMDIVDLVLTDSGGIQEEAPSLGKPVLVLREETERIEAVEAGTVKLIGPSRKRIVAETERLLRDQQAYAEMAEAISPYGDGKAAQRIVRVLLEKLP
jgi:UDP-N-acetylglucosamine 2-epimerase (non-hydrolysing)